MASASSAGPIFIGGLDRCGKTLLRALLVSHPNIAIPEVGSNYWTFFYGQYGNLKESKNVERCLAAMLRYTHVRLLDPDVERIRKEFQEGERTYARLFELFNKQYAEREGKPRWGDQSGLIESYASLVFAAYPGAQMIHMLRDPRDRYEASLAHAPHGKARAGGATARWMYSVALAQANKKRFPAAYKVVRYETLVCEPETTLRDICAFLGEDYCADMLTMNGASTFRQQTLAAGANESDGSLVSPRFIGRFRGRIPTDEIAFIQSIAAGAMRSHGYGLEAIRFTSKQRLRYASRDWPVNAGRMAAWLGMAMLQRHAPARFGRKPPADKVR